MARKLRIAVSVLFGLATVIVVIFWIRSYTLQDSVRLKILPRFYIQSLAGDARMIVWFERQPSATWFEWRSTRILTHTTAQSDNRIPPFDLNFWPTFARLYLAHWVLALTTGFLAVAPWVRRRYGVRTILGAMTVVAVLLGTIAWIDRSF
jgi:hypothetical protein